MDSIRSAQMADRLIAAWDGVHTLEPLTAADPTFDVAAAYAMQRAVHERRVASGWQAVGRKIGFTNRTIWERYGVNQPIWAHIYARTVHRAEDGRMSLGIGGFVQPRLEPEVVVGLRGDVPLSGDSRDVLEAVDWIAPGFEVVQCHFPGWTFRLPDCIAAFGLHGALVVGPATPLDTEARDRLAVELGEFDAALFRDAEVVDRGRGHHVLGSPLKALQHLAVVLSGQADVAPLRAGEIVTTGSLTDAWPLATGTRWRSDYGTLGIGGLELEVV